MLPPTRRLYWEDDHCFDAVVRILAIDGDRLALDRTCFYAGGGGQPADTGTIELVRNEPLNDIHVSDVIGIEASGDVLWHRLNLALDPSNVGRLAHLRLDRQRRNSLAPYHSLLHVVNTIAMREYDAWITGAQIGVDYSRIDFKIEGFSPALAAALESKVNEVLAANRTLRAFYLSEAEFALRPDLLRTLEVKPHVKDGRVRVVAIDGFDEQACGGTHVHSTAELGRAVIYKVENKGRINKRLYLRLIDPSLQQ